MKTIYDMQNEKDYSYHCDEFEQIVDFQKILRKSDVALLVLRVSDNIVYLFD